jgi:hypothetical protein
VEPGRVTEEQAVAFRNVARSMRHWGTWLLGEDAGDPAGAGFLQWADRLDAKALEAGRGPLRLVQEGAA